MMNFNESPLTTQTLPNSLGGGTTADTGLQNSNQAIQGCTGDSAQRSGKGLKKPKLKSCKVCRTKFEPTRAMQAVCGLGCAVALASDKRKLLGAKERRETAKADRVKRERLKSRADWAREAQAAFNKWVRLRDMGKPCISCKRHHTGQIHAGHYLSRGARPELAYEPLNVHAQCSPCNMHLSGNIALYRKNLVELIGLEKVEWLEGPHEPKHYSIDDLKNIKAIYTAKCKELEKAIG